MTDSKRPDIEGIKARTEKATAGPWDHKGSKLICKGPGFRADEHTIVRATCDARFIAHARTDVSDLCAHALALEEENKRLNAQLYGKYGLYDLQQRRMRGQIIRTELEKHLKARDKTVAALLPFAREMAATSCDLCWPMGKEDSYCIHSKARKVMGTEQAQPTAARMAVEAKKEGGGR